MLQKGKRGLKWKQTCKLEENYRNIAVDKFFYSYFFPNKTKVCSPLQLGLRVDSCQSKIQKQHRKEKCVCILKGKDRRACSTSHKSYYNNFYDNKKFIYQFMQALTIFPCLSDTDSLACFQETNG